jgi:hypothetical protein
MSPPLSRDIPEVEAGKTIGIPELDRGESDIMSQSVIYQPSPE